MCVCLAILSFAGRPIPPPTILPFLPFPSPSRPTVDCETPHQKKEKKLSLPRQVCLGQSLQDCGELEEEEKRGGISHALPLSLRLSLLRLFPSDLQTQSLVAFFPGEYRPQNKAPSSLALIRGSKSNKANTYTYISGEEGEINGPCLLWEKAPDLHRRTKKRFALVAPPGKKRAVHVGWVKGFSRSALVPLSLFSSCWPF